MYETDRREQRLIGQHERDRRQDQQGKRSLCGLTGRLAGEV